MHKNKKELRFKYKDDVAGKMSIKKIADKGETQLLYETRNQPVRTQDSLQGQNGLGCKVLKSNKYYFFNGVNKYSSPFIFIS